MNLILKSTLKNHQVTEEVLSLLWPSGYIYIVASALKQVMDEVCSGSKTSPAHPVAFQNKMEGNGGKLHGFYLLPVRL